ncbi:MAG: FIST N-terminal domain-containing protein [Bacteroidota bacterium]
MELTLTSSATKAGTGFSQNENSFQAGIEIADKAMAGSKLSSETLFFLFATPHHKVDQLMKGIRSVVGDQPKFLGCTTTGLVTNEFLSYTGALAGGAFISSDTPFFKIFHEQNIKEREFDAGKNLAQKLRDADTPDDEPVILFYDSLKTTSVEGQPELNVATPILEGFYSYYKHWPVMAGMGAMGDINFNYPCAAWGDNEIERHFLVAATISGPLKMDNIILHGTRPVGAYHTITKADKNIIFELDGKPALDVIDELLSGTVPWEEFPLLVTLGVNNGDKFGEYNEENYASRLCLAIDRKQKALIMFETDLTEGTEVQLMQRNIDFKYIQPQVDKLMAKVGNRKPVLALYIDCLGRVCGYSGLPQEESLEVIKATGAIPFFGIFSGVEIANVGPTVNALDWTGVLCIFSEE